MEGRYKALWLVATWWKSCAEADMNRFCHCQNPYIPQMLCNIVVDKSTHRDDNSCGAVNIRSNKAAFLGYVVLLSLDAFSYHRDAKSSNRRAEVKVRTISKSFLAIHCLGLWQTTSDFKTKDQYIVLHYLSRTATIVFWIESQALSWACRKSKSNVIASPTDICMSSIYICTRYRWKPPPS